MAPADKTEERSIVKFVLEMRNRLERYREEAKENLQQAQASQKKWYDQQARFHQLQPGQKVLLLLPTSTSKLLAKWQGPYTVVRKMGPVTYEIHHPDKRKSHQTYHVNLLKEWKEAPNETPERSLMVRKVDDEEEDELAPEVRPQRHPAKVNLSHLNDPLRAEIQDLLDRFPLLFRQRPGRTELVQHSIHLTDTTPSRQRPYRIPERLPKPLGEEIEMMKQLHVIEPVKV